MGRSKVIRQVRGLVVRWLRWCNTSGDQHDHAFVEGSHHKKEVFSGPLDYAENGKKLYLKVPPVGPHVIHHYSGWKSCFYPPLGWILPQSSFCWSNTFMVIGYIKQKRDKRTAPGYNMPLLVALTMGPYGKGLGSKCMWKSIEPMVSIWYTKRWKTYLSRTFYTLCRTLPLHLSKFHTELIFVQK